MHLGPKGVRLLTVVTVIVCFELIALVALSVRVTGQSAQRDRDLRAANVAVCERTNTRIQTNAAVNAALDRVETAQTALINGVVTAALPQTDPNRDARSQALIDAFYSQVQPLRDAAISSQDDFRRLYKSVEQSTCS